MPMNKAPVITVARHRIATDGPGVTSLVCFHGCPLRCKYCINAFSYAPGTRRMETTAERLYERLKVDALYFLATGGGVTFGGGEPLLYADFLADFRRICGAEWHLCAETSLAVPWEQVERAAGCIDFFLVDVKDTDPDIYRRYTGQDNRLMLENLRRLTEVIPPERIKVRLPLIPGFNTEEDRKRSMRRLETTGIRQFELFTYRIKENV